MNDGNLAQWAHAFSENCEFSFRKVYLMKIMLYEAVLFHSSEIIHH